MVEGHTTDEEAPLNKKADAPPSIEDLDPEKDPDLVKNGGKFTSKQAILQVTWRLPVDPNPLNIIALIYGYLPFVIPLTFFVNMCITRRFMPFFGLVVAGIVTVINEVILKPILKQPRPSASANRKFNDKTGKWEMKPGMPSGHVLNASTMLVWCILEVAFRGPGFGANGAPFITGWLILLIIVTMAPVPWARIHNGDHSLAQCLVGGSLGLVAGVAAFYVRAQYFPQDEYQTWCAGSWKVGSTSLCLESGKPWDDFLPENLELTTTAAATMAAIATKIKEAASVVSTTQGLLRGSEQAEEATGQDQEEEEAH